MKKIHLFSVIYTAFIIWTIIIVNSGGSNSAISLVRSLPYGDKIGHFIVMGCLALLINLSLQYKMVNIVKFSAPLGSLLVLTVVVLEEFTQMTNINRTFDVFDLAADLAGISFFSYFGFKLLWKKKYA